MKFLGLFFIKLFLIALMLGFGPYQDSFSFSEVIQNAELQNIIIELRLPKTLLAIAAGLGLAIAGLLMQAFFQNPLAGPYVLGVQSSGSLFMALTILLAGSNSFFASFYGKALSSAVGSGLFFLVLLGVASKIKGKSIILILGILFSQVAGGLLGIFQAISSRDQLKEFSLWNLGSFERVPIFEASIVFIFILIIVALSFSQMKNLNLLRLGDSYAPTLGVNLQKLKMKVIIIVPLITGILTALCGPIVFVGIMTPHIARWINRSEDLSQVAITCIFLGPILTLIAQFFVDNMNLGLPINVYLGLVGAPVIMVYLFKERNRGVFA